MQPGLPTRANLPSNCYCGTSRSGNRPRRRPNDWRRLWNHRTMQSSPRHWTERSSVGMRGPKESTVTRLRRLWDAPFPSWCPPIAPTSCRKFSRNLRGENGLPTTKRSAVRKDGRRIHISLTISPLMDSEGKIVGASMIARDITKQKQAEEELQCAKESSRQGQRPPAVSLRPQGSGDTLGPNVHHFTAFHHAAACSRHRALHGRRATRRVLARPFPKSHHPTT